jgi:hypothetical protein
VRVVAAGSSNIDGQRYEHGPRRKFNPRSALLSQRSRSPGSCGTQVAWSKNNIYIWYPPSNNDNLGFCYISDCNRLQIYFSEIHGSKIQDPRCHGGLGSEILDPSFISVRSMDPRSKIQDAMRVLDLKSWIHLGSKIQDPRFPGGLGGVTMLVFNLPGSRINSSLF